MNRSMANHKNVAARLRRKLLILLVLVGIGIAPVLKAHSVHAALGGYVVSVKNTQNIVLDTSYKKTPLITSMNSWYRKEVKVTSVKSSNPSVVKTELHTDFSLPLLTTKKAGTTKITVNAEVEGRKQQYIWNVKVVKAENPFKSIKVNGKSYKGIISKMFPVGDTVSISGKTFKFKYQLKKNWKLITKKPNVEYYENNGTKYKKGKTYKVAKNSEKNIIMRFENTKTKMQKEIVFNLSNFDE
ncbi:MAG: hypothetical protein IJ860_00655 [Eubacterium sp.]|nr:hypothetical protein [Eubacterium sp.]